MQIDLDRSSREPLYRQLALSLLQRIRNGALPANTRLPTVRQLAQQLGVTRLTVHSAYAELQSGGWIEATVGRGTFVAGQIDQMLMPPEARLGRELTPAGMLSDMLHMTQLPGLTAMAKADPAPEWFPLRNWQRANEMALSAGGPGLMNYTTSQGDLVLRSTIAEFVRESGISAGPDEIMIVAGVSQGMSLTTDLLARPGDTVLVEQPTYLGMLNILSARGIRAVGVPVDSEGMIIEELEALVRSERPAFVYTMPAFQNPTGVCMSQERRAALVELADRYALPIVEDDIYGRLNYEGPTLSALKSQDRNGRVIYMSSFSKSLMPGIRMGYVVASPSIICQLVHKRQAHDLCSSPLTQRALAFFIEQGWWHTHHKRMLPRYRERRDALLRAMERFFPMGISWTKPAGGFVSWVTLRPEMSVTDLYLSAISRGIAFTPGAVFQATPDNQQHLRLCFSVETPDRLTDAVATLGMLLRERNSGQRIATPIRSDYVPVV